VEPGEGAERPTPIGQEALVSRSKKPAVQPVRPSTDPPAKKRRHVQPFPPSVRREALDLVSKGVKRSEIARSLGMTTESIRNWVIAARADGTFPSTAGNSARPPSPPAPAASPAAPEPPWPPTAPHDPGSGLGEHEVAAILELKKKHPVMGPAQIRAQLKRFKGWRISVRAIARTLLKNGYELEHRGSQPKGEREPTRFEAPWRNALWQLDLAELQIGGEHRSLLLVEDDFSRFIVHHALLEHPSSEAVVAVVQEAVALHGKPEAVYTDRGGQFLAWLESSSFQRFLEAMLIDHHVSAAYRPRGRGKIEAAIRTLRRELWELMHFESVEEAERGISDFVRDYNHRRAHMGIDGLVPADRFFGRFREVKAAVEAQSRRRQGAALLQDSLHVTEEIPPANRAEVLRIMVVDGALEIRFLGHRVPLGRLEA
jgi:transposase InsO family protein